MITRTPERAAAITGLWLDDCPTLGQMGSAETRAYLERTSYRAFLRSDWGLDVPAADLFTRRTIGVFGSPAGCVPALECMRVGLPGFNATTVDGVGRYRWLDDPEVRFPDGLATIARKILERVEPRTSGRQWDPATLDDPANQVRVRLASAVTGVRNTAGAVEVDYHRGGRGYRVEARHCVYAGTAQGLAKIAAEVGDEQRLALTRVVKPPMCYVKVALRNWRAFAELGIHEVFAPAAFFYKIELEPNPGDHAKAGVDPDRAAVVLLCHRPVVDPEEADYRAEAAVAREAMRLMSPEDYLREVDHQLGQILRPTGFDPEAIIATVIVNRWPHTYSPTLNTLTDDSVSYASEMLLSRQPFGRIAIAGVDSHRFGWAQAAVDAAERAVNELPSGGRQMRFDEH